MKTSQLTAKLRLKTNPATQSFDSVAGELRTRNETSAGAFSLPRGFGLDMRHRLPNRLVWRRRFCG